MPKVKSHVPVREALVAVAATVAPFDWLGIAVGVTTIAVGVGEDRAEVGVTPTGIGEGEGRGEAVGTGVGVSGASVLAGKGTMVGVDEAAAAPLKATLQPLSRISRIKNKPISVVFLIIGIPPVSNVGQSRSQTLSCH